jgi:transposase
MREGVEVRLLPGDRKRLEAVVSDRKSPQHHVWWARIVLMTADGTGTMAIRAAAGKGKPTIWRWQERYVQDGAGGLFRHAPRGRAFPAASPEQVAAVVERTLHETPPAATHWTLRLIAKASGLAPSTVHRIWREHGLKPHRVETFKLSNDLRFVEKLRDIVGLYVNPPEHALVLSVDEKSQIQALDRTQPGLPMKRGRGATMTHDYKRHGTTTLFAALDVKAGTVISQCMLRHRAAEFIRFLRLIDRQTPTGFDLHLILDNYAAHKTEAVKRWLARHPRFHVHFTPTSASWINAVEGLFATLTKRRLKRGVFRSIIELNQAIRDYLDAHNADPNPFRWTAPPTPSSVSTNAGNVCWNHSTRISDRFSSTPAGEQVWSAAGVTETKGTNAGTGARHPLRHRHPSTRPTSQAQGRRSRRAATPRSPPILATLLRTSLRSEDRFSREKEGGRRRTGTAYLTIARRWLFGKRRPCSAHNAAQTLNLPSFVPPIQNV